MAYCSANDLKVLVSTHSEVLRLTESKVDYDREILQSILEAASSLVDRYIDVVNNADPFVRMQTAKIAVYYLFQRVNAEAPQTVIDGFKEAMATLVDLSRKQIRRTNDVKSPHSTIPYPRRVTPIPYSDIY